MTDSKTKTFLKFSFVFCLYVAFYKIVDSMTLQSHGDPFYYHLSGPKTLFYHGVQVLRHDLQIFAQAGWFDLLYLIPIALFKDLITVQVLGQVMHWTASAGIAALLFSKWFRESPIRWVAVLGIMTIGRDFAFLHYAKNDGVVAMLALLAVRAITQRWKPWQIGLILGMIPSVKINGLLVSGSIGMICLYHYRRDRKALLTIVGVAFASLLPALVKNYWFTGNPFYPAFPNLFRGTISAELYKWNQYFFSSRPSGDSVYLNLLDYSMCKIVCWLAVPLAIWKLRTRRFEHFEYLIASLLIILIYTFTNGAYQGARFFYSAFFLLIGFTFFALTEVKLKPWMMYGLLVLTAVDGNISFSPRKIGTILHDAWIKPTADALRDSIGQSRYPALMDPDPAWETIVLSDMRTDYFHLPPAYRFQHVSNSVGTAFLLTCDQPGDLEKLDQFRYFWLSRKLDNPCYQAIRQRGLNKGVVSLDGVDTDVIEWKSR